MFKQNERITENSDSDSKELCIENDNSQPSSD
jgi:hypothetical protein